MIIIDHPSKPGLVLEEKGLAVPQQGQAGAAPRGDLRNHRITRHNGAMDFILISLIGPGAIYFYGNFRILKWSCCTCYGNFRIQYMEVRKRTIFLAICWGDIPLN